jgi:RNA polymerase sigma-54 factor
MAQGPGLHQVQRLSLQQILAPQLQQSLHLLQVSSLELNQLVHEELQQNPLLEEQSKDEPRVEVDGSSDDGAPIVSERTEEQDFKQEFETLSKLDEEWREYFSQTSTFRPHSAQADEHRQHFFDSIAQQESLQQHLLQQLNFIEQTPEQRKVSELIIGNVNDDGYLLAPLEEMAISSGTPLDQLQRALETIQTFHPVGVGARNLKECLLIQLERLGKSESIEAVLVNLHLDDLGKRRFPEIARTMNLTLEQVQQIANFISTLEPKPGRLFTIDEHHYVAPDVVVTRMEGEYAVLINDEQIPHLRISNTYKELMASTEKVADAKEYIREKIRAGKFLIKSIHQRQQTIYNIAKVIVERQREFLDKGISCLKPLTMAQVAEVVGVHETTVSRAVANKYMQTPQGLYEMKFFFTPGFETASGSSLSNTSVKDAINQLVQHEDSTKPLSDQEIVALLKEKGIPIARRTVAKYRNELNILPSNLRKQY